jgi:hypothetical protein
MSGDLIKRKPMSDGALTLPKMDGVQIAPRVWLIGEPTPIVGTDRLRCLADVGGALAVVELRLRFAEPTEEGT